MSLGYVRSALLFVFPRCLKHGKLRLHVCVLTAPLRAPGTSNRTGTTWKSSISGTSLRLTCDLCCKRRRKCGRMNWRGITASADMILRYVDARILPGYAAVERGQLHGYAFFVYEGNKGVIGDLYVAHEHAPNGKESPVEKKLVTHVLETLQESPGVHRIEAQLLLHETGRVAGPFLHQGFQRYPRLFMELALPGRGRRQRRVPRRRVPSNCGAGRRAITSMRRQLITACYRGHIDSQINDQYRTVQRSAALPEQHCALSRLRSFRRQFFRSWPSIGRPGLRWA